MTWQGYAVTTVFGSGGDDRLSITHTVCGTEYEFGMADYVDNGVPLDRYLEWRDGHVCPDAVRAAAKEPELTVRWAGGSPPVVLVEQAELDELRESGYPEAVARLFDRTFSHGTVPPALAGPRAGLCVDGQPKSECTCRDPGACAPTVLP